MPSAQGYFTLSAAHIAAIRQILKKQTSGSERVYLPPALHQPEKYRLPHFRREGAKRLTGFVWFHIFNCIELLQFRKHRGGVIRGTEQ
jgi:hypothetical protein